MSDTQTTKTDDSLSQNIEGFLKTIVESIVPSNAKEQATSGVGRKKILPSLVLWSGVMVGMLRGFTSQADIWRLVSWKGFWDYPGYGVSDQAVYNRLAEEGNQSLQKLFIQVRDGLKERLAPFEQKEIAPFATAVYGIDGSTLDKVARHLPSLREIVNGDSRLLPGKLLGAFNIRLQQWEEMIHLPNPNQNDKAVARELVQNMPEGSLILADLGFFGFAWFDQLTDWKMWWVSRVRDKTTYEIIHTYYEDGDLFDGLIWLGKYRSDKAAHAVRLVTFTLGKTHFRYLTNVLDPHVLTMHDIAVLYARRWDIELAFKMIKRHLNLHIIWSGKPTVILQQVWATLTISQILHAIQLEIAHHAGVDPFDVSLDLVTRYVPSLAYEGKNPLQMILDDGRRVGIIRPSRRIRPQTPSIEGLPFNPLPDNIILKRKARYAERRCDSHTLASLGGTKASEFEPLLC